MPILLREPGCHPPDLFKDGDVPAACAEASWWLAYTRSRREKDLARRLVVEGVSFYCPIVPRRSRARSGRVRETFVPLFSGYVFLLGSGEDRVTALRTNCASAVLPVADGTGLARDLSRIRRLIASGRPVTPEERLEPGRPVRVISGPLRGQEGIVIERLGRRRLLVTVELLRRGASAELDECDVEPA